MEIFGDFAKKIVTKEDLIFFLEEINLVQGLIFKNINIPLSKRVKGNISEEDKSSSSPLAKARVSEDFRKELEELEKKKIISKNPEENRIFFENFKKYLQNLPQVKIEMAFQPKKEFVNKIFLWLEKEINQKVVLDLIFNPEIIGGAIIEYQGRQINFSLAKKIDELVSQKQL
jgi:hypothetical protein